MTTQTADMIDLVREYGIAMFTAGLTDVHSADEAQRVTDASQLFARLAALLQQVQAVVDAANDLELARHRNNTATYADFCLWHALERLGMALEPAPEDEDTQPVDTTAVLDALEY